MRTVLEDTGNCYWQSPLVNVYRVIYIYIVLSSCGAGSILCLHTLAVSHMNAHGHHRECSPLVGPGSLQQLYRVPPYVPTYLCTYVRTY